MARTGSPPPEHRFELDVPDGIGGVDPGVFNMVGQAGPGATELAAGVSLMQAMTSPLIANLQAQVRDLQARLTEANDRIRDDRDAHRDELRKLEDRFREKIDEAKERATTAAQELQIEKLRAEFSAKSDSSPLARVAENAVDSLPAILAAFTAQGQVSGAAAPLAPADPALADAPTTAPTVAPAAEVAQDPEAMRAALLQKFESALLRAAADGLRSGGNAGSVVSQAMQTAVGALARLGLEPDAATLARTALRFALSSMQDGHAATAVADALRPVIQATGQAQALLATLSPETAADTLAALAGAQLTPDARTLVAEVVRALVSPAPSLDADALDDATLNALTAPEGASR